MAVKQRWLSTSPLAVLVVLLLTSACGSFAAAAVDPEQQVLAIVDCTVFDPETETLLHTGYV